MVQALKEEIEKLESEEAQEETSEEAETEEKDQDESGEEEQEEQETQEADAEADNEEEAKEPSEEEKLAKQKAYKERQEQKKREREEALNKHDNAVDLTTSKATAADKEQASLASKQAEEFIARQIFEDRKKAATKELKALEKDFKEAFDDYDDVVEFAVQSTVKRLVAQGLDEDDALEKVQTEKLMLADRAAAQGRDPVQAIYDEAIGIKNWMDSVAEEMGYVRGEKVNGKKPKTNLQAMREASKPNAMTGGTGKGTTATKRTFDDLGDDDLEEIKETTIWDLQ